MQQADRLIDEHGRIISDEIKYPNAGREVLWRIDFGFSQVFHRSFLKYSDLWALSFDYFGDRMGHDNWIAFLSSLLGHTLVIDDVLVHYRRHNRNAVLFARPTVPVNIIRNLDAILSRFYRRGVEFQKKREEMIGAILRSVKAAKARQTVIEHILPQISEEQARSLRDHLQYYRDFEHYQSQRLIAYLPQSRIERLHAAFRTYRQGLYQAQGRNGAREAIADLVYGVAN